MNILDSLKRFIAPLEHRIYLMIGRAILVAINNSGKTQRANLTGLWGEKLANVERMQEYGIETYPWTDSEGTVLFLNGNRGHGLIICVSDRRYRPLDLSQGEICLYTDEDKETDQHRIRLKRNQIIEILAKILNMDFATSASITVPTLTVTGNLIVNGDITATGDVSDSSGAAQTMAAMRLAYNSHTHPIVPPSPSPQM